jgi:hypothetical protein
MKMVAKSKNKGFPPLKVYHQTPFTTFSSLYLLLYIKGTKMSKKDHEYVLAFLSKRILSTLFLFLYPTFFLLA